MSAKTFCDIVAWQRAHALALQVYRATKVFPKEEQFCLTSQMRRCAVSVPSNIAEGFKRKNIKDSLHFYNIAQGSFEELKYQLLLSQDLEYIKPDVYHEVNLRADEVGRVLYGWIKSHAI